MIGIVQGLLDILAMFAGSAVLISAVVLCGMTWSGKLTLPGTDARRVQRADNDAQIAQFRFEAAQSNLNREIMETRGQEQITALLEAAAKGQFAKQLEEGKTA